MRVLRRLWAELTPEAGRVSQAMTGAEGRRSVNWDAFAAIEIMVAVFVALWPIFGEERRRRSQARSLRLRLCSKLTILRPTLGKYIPGISLYPGAVLDPEAFKSVVDLLSTLLQESGVLEAKEQDAVGVAIANLEMTALAMGAIELDAETAGNLLDLIDSAVRTMGHYGLLHSEIQTPWEKAPAPGKV